MKDAIEILDKEVKRCEQKRDEFIKSHKSGYIIDYYYKRINKFSDVILFLKAENNTGS